MHLTRRFGTQFQFEVPEDWSENREGGRFVYRAPGSELQELIVQGHLLSGVASAAEEAAALKTVISNMLHSLESVFAEPSLAGGMVKHLGPDAMLPSQTAWSAAAVSQDDDTFFCGVVFQGHRGALLYTFEAASAAVGVDTYLQLVRTVRRIGEGGSAGRPPNKGLQLSRALGAGAYSLVGWAGPRRS